MQGHFLFLGSGGSMGVPVVNCSCSVCTSDEKKNQRLRSSALITVGGKNFLIDCGPDFRQQALTYGIKSIDCCLITHIHHDHTAGLDELRAFTMHKEKSLPCFTSTITGEDLKKRFQYLFRTDSARLTTKIELHLVDKERGSFTWEEVNIQYMTFEQAGISVLGFRFGSCAYLSDIKKYPSSIFQDLQGVETLVLSALRYTPSKLHFSIDEAVDFARRAKAKMTYLTHISHDLDYEKTNAYLPKDVQLSYDGLSFQFTMESLIP